MGTATRPAVAVAIISSIVPKLDLVLNADIDQTTIWCPVITMVKMVL